MSVSLSTSVRVQRNVRGAAGARVNAAVAAGDMDSENEIASGSSGWTTVPGTGDTVSTRGACASRTTATVAHVLAPTPSVTQMRRAAFGASHAGRGTWKVPTPFAIIVERSGTNVMPSSATSRVRAT